jgi:putative FmdB family regulatory protein
MMPLAASAVNLNITKDVNNPHGYCIYFLAVFEARPFRESCAYPVLLEYRLNMPIYDYRCSRCAHEFELLVLRTSPAPVCPACESQNVEQLLSSFAVNSEGTRQASLDKARRSYKASGQRKDEQVAAVEYEQKERAEHGLD